MTRLRRIVPDVPVPPGPASYAFAPELEVLNTHDDPDETTHMGRTRARDTGDKGGIVSFVIGIQIGLSEGNIGLSIRPE